MTKEKALKLALEALEASHLLIHGGETKGGLVYCMDGYYSSCFDVEGNNKLLNEAITAIKEALAQPEQEPVGTVGDLFDERVISHRELDRDLLVYTAPSKEKNT